MSSRKTGKQQQKNFWVEARCSIHPSCRNPKFLCRSILVPRPDIKAQFYGYWHHRCSDMESPPAMRHHLHTLRKGCPSGCTQHELGMMACAFGFCSGITGRNTTPAFVCTNHWNQMFILRKKMLPRPTSIKSHAAYMFGHFLRGICPCFVSEVGGTGGWKLSRSKSIGHTD